jgi:hypothetical protein
MSEAAGGSAAAVTASGAAKLGQWGFDLTGKNTAVKAR